MANKFYRERNPLSRFWLGKSVGVHNELTSVIVDNNLELGYEKKKKVVFFDVDNVFIAGQTQQLMVSYFFRKKKIKINKLPLLLKIFYGFCYIKLELFLKDLN